MVSDVEKALKWINHNHNQSLQTTHQSKALNTGAPPVRLTVYYECLCPYSVKFITEKLFPLHENLLKAKAEILDISLVPFGNAMVSIDFKTFMKLKHSIFKIR